MERDQGLALELNTEPSSVQAQILTVAGQETMAPGSLGRYLPIRAAKTEWQGVGHVLGGWVWHSLGHI